MDCSLLGQRSLSSGGLLGSRLTSRRNSLCHQIFFTVEILCRSISFLAAAENSRRLTFPGGNMESSGASATPNRETIDGEVLPLATADRVSVTVEDAWDLNSALNASTQASGVFKMLPIHTDIDPIRDYAFAVRPEFRPAAQSPPPATPPSPADVPEPVAWLIVLRDLKVPHERSQEEPPAPFLEGEDFDDEAESDEDQAGGNSTSAEPPGKLARVKPGIVTAGNLATLGLADEGFAFASVLEAHVPAGPAKK